MKTKTKATKKPKLSKMELQIKKLNAAYQKATPAQRRVMIAKDALKQIETGQINPMSGTYINLWGDGHVEEGKPLQPVLLDEASAISCDCCAKGAMFISCVRLSNRYHGNPSGIDSDEINSLVNWPKQNYDEIEAAFEGFYGDKGQYSDWIPKWEQKYPTDRERLPAILKNIIRNKGTFKKNEV